MLEKLNRVYFSNPAEYHVDNHGWVTMEKYFEMIEEKKVDKYNQISLKYGNPHTGETGTEDFNKISLCDKNKNDEYKLYEVEFRLFESGRGQKRVAKRIVTIGDFVAKNPKDVRRFVEKVYPQYIAKGYEMKVRKIWKWWFT